MLYEENVIVDDLLKRLIQMKGDRMTFVYGPMGSGKSTVAIALAKRCEAQGERPMCVVAGAKPREAITSRSGGRVKAATLSQTLGAEAELTMGNRIIVDEAQFLTTADVRKLQQLSKTHGCRIYSFGLYWKSDGEVFEGASAFLDYGAEMIVLPHEMRCWCGAPAVADVLRPEEHASMTSKYMSACARHRREPG